MPPITHHIPDAMLAAYASGNLPHAFALVVATHISLCLECRAASEAHHMVGGAVLDASNGAELSDNLKSDILSQLDAPAPVEHTYRRSGIFPAPVMEALRGKPPRWRTLGLGVRQSILSADREGSVRLLYIPPGQAVPNHTHNGLELTLVLQGSFSDKTGQFVLGDLELADEYLEHIPTADVGEPCICLAATDAPLRFKAWIPRLLQPVFRI